MLSPIYGTNTIICHICNSTLGPDDVKHTPEYGRGDFAPCPKCLIIVKEVFKKDEDTSQLSLWELLLREDTEEENEEDLSD